MDRLVYVAMSGAKETLRAQAANNHNLANANTNGFRADLSAFQTQNVAGPGLPSRAYATNDMTGWDASSGSLDADRAGPGRRDQGPGLDRRAGQRRHRGLHPRRGPARRYRPAR